MKKHITLMLLLLSGVVSLWAQDLAVPLRPISAGNYSVACPTTATPMRALSSQTTVQTGAVRYNAVTTATPMPYSAVTTVHTFTPNFSAGAMDRVKAPVPVMATEPVATLSPRRAPAGGDDDDDWDPMGGTGDWGNPGEPGSHMPLGNELFVLLACALAYTVLRILKKQNTNAL